VKEYCRCGIRKENENQGGQRKDGSQIKGGGLGKINDHGRVCELGKIIGWGNSLASRWIRCQQPGETETSPWVYLSTSREQGGCDTRYVHSRVNKDTMYSEVSVGIVF
jgi:hypothetical protein